MFVLEILKEMQAQGIFELSPSDDDLDTIIHNAKSYDDIECYYQKIQDYIKLLDVELQHNYNVPIAGTLSDFCDKFHYELFDIFYTNNDVFKKNTKISMDTLIKNAKSSYISNIPKNGIYEKDIDFKSAGIGLFGLSSIDDVRFKLEERKLYKLINHYYIKLKSKEYFQDDIFYIPFNQLKSMFVSGPNNKDVKDTLIDTCNRLNNKRVYWDMSNTKYHSELGKNLNKCKDVKLVDVVIIYQPRKHEKGINGEVYTIKGILCRVNNFMKMRYMLRQISNDFPTPCLRAKYLEFIIAEKITYHLHLLNGGNNKRTKTITDGKLRSGARKAIQKNIKDYFVKSISNLATEIHYYDTEQSAKSYFARIILNSSKAKERIEDLIKAIVNVSWYLVNNENFNYQCEITVNNKSVKLFYMPSYKPRKAQEIYNEILHTIDSRAQRGRVLEFFKAGDIKLKIKF